MRNLLRHLQAKKQGNLKRDFQGKILLNLDIEKQIVLKVHILTSSQAYIPFHEN